MTRLLPVRARSTRAAIGAAALASVTALTLTGAASPAQSAPTTDCPAAVPDTDLTPGQAVTGLTVSTGTTPDSFTGTVLGVLNDGIAPGVDMIMVRLTSPEIDRVGIWEGMSGSPVYAEDGRLIGAVSYGLSTGPSTVAGVTPAANMEALLNGGAGPDAKRFAAKVKLNKAVTKAIVASGAASAADADQGMSKLRLPVTISGMVNSSRLNDLAKGLHISGARVMTGPASVPTSPTYDLAPGGNLAATISFGDVTVGGVGTVTVVCGSEILGFGHPLNFVGDSTYFMHGANAIYVQEDPTLAGFKVANLGAPSGTVTGDHLAGILGESGALPEFATATSTTTLGGGAPKSGSTYIAVQDFVPDIGTSELVSNQDVTMDYIGKGSGTMGYDIEGTRQDGTPFSVTRSDVYSDDFDLSYATANDLANALYSIYYNGSQQVKIDSVTTTSNLDKSTGTYTVSKVRAFVRGAWRTLSQDSTVVAKAGATKRFHVILTSPQFGSRNVTVTLSIPATAHGKSGSVDVFGGNQGSFDEGDIYGDGSSSDAPSLDRVIHSLESAPHHDDVVADMQLYTRFGNPAAHRQARKSTGHVVNGDFAFGIFIR